MIKRLKKTVPVALPVMLGYLAIGLPSGILAAQVGVPAWACFVVSATVYSGAGQFMFPNMVLAGASPLAIIASISLVNTRQVLYSAAFAPFFRKASRLLTVIFSATVTDETFGINLDKLSRVGEDWTPQDALAINLESMFSWATANCVGAMVGPLLALPTEITSFAMTSIFICLLVGQQMRIEAVVALVVAVLGVAACKLVGLGGLAVFIGALLGVIAGTVYGAVKS
ncbi:AzlC family ABC transporter permease [Atopobium sp. oral taxon 810]|uniref:AzlC family ABC transporter permease n=1 Tax=Atopobium sp. oral taxon 810 TaxID=712158 RepID=UPI0003970675|nr:AzlC family ABC transporter permease [Atopobium sp. oral taxon 810]ERI06524.1 putative azaleucine resistance protein AzlC [Atopobium sp. oral taxon 810 str. F0209]